MTDKSKAEAVGVDREGSTTRTTDAHPGQILRANRYLASAVHSLSCRANGFTVSGGVTDGSMCDCGLTAARSLLYTFTRDDVQLLGWSDRHTVEGSEADATIKAKRRNLAERIEELLPREYGK